MIEENSFRDGMIKIMAIYYDRYKEDPDGTLKFFCHTTVPLSAVVSVYGYLVSDGTIVPIEDIDQGIKNKLWNHAKSAKEDITQELAIKLCKAIWAMQSLLEKENIN